MYAIFFFNTPSSQLPGWGEGISHVSQKNAFGDAPINVAATRKSLSESSLLLDAGADINEKGEHGYTPLHSAVEQGSLELVSFLVDRGADISAANDDGVTPLQLAIMLREYDIQRFLTMVSEGLRRK